MRRHDACLVSAMLASGLRNGGNWVLSSAELILGMAMAGLLTV